jgi:hypothetical protein
MSAVRELTTPEQIRERVQQMKDDGYDKAKPDAWRMMLAISETAIGNIQAGRGHRVTREQLDQITLAAYHGPQS